MVATGFYRKHGVRACSEAILGNPRFGAPVAEFTRKLNEMRSYSFGRARTHLRQEAKSTAAAPDRVDGTDGHMGLAPGIRAKPLAMKRVDDRGQIRQQGGRQRCRPVASALRRSIPVRTSAGSKDPALRFVEANLVAHSGPSMRGSSIQTLVL